jgi:hypothetical protein
VRRSIALPLDEPQKHRQKTYNSGYSLVVTHLTTNPPVRCLNRAERTGSLVFNVLWSYVLVQEFFYNIIYTTMNFGRVPQTTVLRVSFRRLVHVEGDFLMHESSF